MFCRDAKWGRYPSSYLQSDNKVFVFERFSQGNETDIWPFWFICLLLWLWLRPQDSLYFNNTLVFVQKKKTLEIFHFVPSLLWDWSFGLEHRVTYILGVSDFEVKGLGLNLPGSGLKPTIFCTHRYITLPQHPRNCGWCVALQVRCLWLEGCWVKSCSWQSDASIGSLSKALNPTWSSDTCWPCYLILTCMSPWTKASAE